MCATWECISRYVLRPIGRDIPPLPEAAEAFKSRMQPCAQADGGADYSPGSIGFPWLSRPFGSAPGKNVGVDLGSVSMRRAGRLLSVCWSYSRHEAFVGTASLRFFPAA
jgi:hypothetical protein